MGQSYLLLDLVFDPRLPNSVWERAFGNSVSRPGAGEDHILTRNRVSRTTFPNRVWERGFRQSESASRFANGNPLLLSANGPFYVLL